MDRQRLTRILSSLFDLNNIYSISPEDLQRRLTARPKLDEVLALAFTVGMLGVLVFIQYKNHFITYYDLMNFLYAGRGNFIHYYYAYWAVPVFALLAKLSFPYEFLLVGFANILGVWFAIRVFNGKLVPLLVSFHVIYILGQGQIVGILAGGFALFILGLVLRRWTVAGLGALIILTKFQFGFIPVAWIWLSWDAEWKNKFKVLILPGILIIVSLFLYPMWPLQLYQTVQNAPPDSSGSISLWQWIGPFALVFWLPPLLLKLSRQERLWLFLCANALALPYFQQTDLILLFTLFPGYGAVAANIPFIVDGLGILPDVPPWQVIQFLFLIPLVVYGITLFRVLRKAGTA